jgi:hypothetical protein
MTDYHVIVSVPSIGRCERINQTPSTLCEARRVMYSFAARLETMANVYEVENDYWVGERGELCEGLRWRYADSDSAPGCMFTVHIMERRDVEAGDEEEHQWIPD